MTAQPAFGPCYVPWIWAAGQPHPCVDERGRGPGQPGAGPDRGAADTMNCMIDAMLGLAHSARQPLSHTVVALDVLVAQARRTVEDEAEGRTIEWQIGALPHLMGDAATLQQVLGLCCLHLPCGRWRVGVA